MHSVSVNLHSLLEYSHQWCIIGKCVKFTHFYLKKIPHQSVYNCANFTSSLSGKSTLTLFIV